VKWWGAVGDGRALLSIARELHPDVIVLDIAMPLLNGLDAGRQLKQLMPNIKLIFLTMNEDPDLAAEAFRIGASGYLLKNSAGSELSQAIQMALCGKTYVTPLAAHGMVETFIQGPCRAGTPGKLTPRQREVLQLLAEGHSMKEVGNILNVTPRTIAFHKYRMMEDFHIKTNAELIQFAIKQRLITSSPR
jgi:DNA-binding NarL/FixJ family response regulator